MSMDTKPVEPSTWKDYVPSWGQAWASGRHVITFAAGQIGGVATAITVLHIATPEQAQVMVDSVNKVVSGGTTLIDGATGLIAVSIAIYAGWRKTSKNLIREADAVPGVGGVAIDHNATGGAAEAAADPTMPNVKKGVVVPVAAPPPAPTALGKEAS